MTNEAEQEIQPVNKKKTTQMLWKVIGILFALFAVGVVIYLLYAVNTRFIEMNGHLGQLTDSTQNKLQQLEEQIAAVQKNTDTALQDVTTKVSQMQATNKDEWKLADAHYLVKLANDKVQFEDNVSEAIVLLKMADQEISDLTDPKVTDIRKALAVDIAALESMPKIDITGLYMRLSALNGKVEQLPLINKPSIVPATNPASNQQRLSWWRQGLQETWQSLRQIVVVRYNETGKLPLIPPELQGYFYQNLHAILSQAIWALLHGETTIYQNSLGQAAAWVKEYCVENSTVTQSMLNELNDVEKIDIHPAAPAITALQAFGGSS